MRYEYWVVRYVPDSIRGEYVNVAVITGNGDDWHFRKTGNLRRAARLGGSASGATVHFFTRLEQSIQHDVDAVEALLPEEGQHPFSRVELEERRGRMKNTIQLSAPRPVLADSAEQAADIAFGLMVVDESAEVQHRSTTLVKTNLRDYFARSEVLHGKFLERSVASIGASEVRIDFAVRNGSVRQLTNVWAFDLLTKDGLSSQADKIGNLSFGFTRIRRGEATLTSGYGRRQEYRISPDVETRAVYVAPRTAEQRRFFDQAMDIWGSAGTKAYDSKDAKEIVSQAEQLLLNH